MVFGDVCLSTHQVRVGTPGKGGWPTVRYFNKETGPEGKQYEKKTSDAMCTELGPGKPHLADLVKSFMGKSEL